ncbi:MAG: hypothetical protein MJ223_02660 [Mycoplasmoidaceae bacterium]|nr:hypothetical protein [Mycoplasmoidaceae bacterium]
MKNKNKLLAPALGFAGLMTSSLSFALVGCGNNNNKEEPAEIQNGITRGGEFGRHKQSDQYETS